MMQKVKVRTPLVEMEGDEMTRVMWQWVRDQLVLPFVDVVLDRFDLSIENRERTNDPVTLEAAKAQGVSLKCSTITPDLARQQALGLSRLYPSPNGTIRNILDGTIFREPVICQNVPRLVPHWSKPVVVARHAYGEQYRAQEIAVGGPGIVKLIYRLDYGAQVVRDVHRFDGPGVALGVFNVDASIRAFARACLNFGLQRGYDVFFSHKSTVLKQYDGRFRDLFAEVFENEFAHAYAKAGLAYAPRLIDDMVAFSVKSSGGYLWACKNYDGDVQSDYLAQGYGSAGLMTSVLMSPDARAIQTETAHGTVARHFERHLRGEPTPTNPLTTIFAWSRALWQRGGLDGTPAVMAFADALEEACIGLVEAGTMTHDLAVLIGPNAPSSIRKPSSRRPPTNSLRGWAATNRDRRLDRCWMGKRGGRLGKRPDG